MADAARPTPRAHARTPLSPGWSRNSQRRAVTSFSNMPPKSFSELLNYDRPPRRERRATRSAFDGGILWLAGRPVAWVRPWHAWTASCRAHSIMVGCTEVVVIAFAAAVLKQCWRPKWKPPA